MFSTVRRTARALTIVMAITLISGPATQATASTKLQGKSMVVTSHAPILNNRVNEFRENLGLQRKGATRVYPLFDQASGKVLAAVQIAGDPGLLLRVASVQAKITREPDRSFLQFLFLSRTGALIKSSDLLGITALINNPSWGEGIQLLGSIAPSAYRTEAITGMISFDLLEEDSFFNLIPGYLFQDQQYKFFLITGPDKFVSPTTSVMIRTRRVADSEIILLIPTCVNEKLPSAHLGMVKGIYCGQPEGLVPALQQQASANQDREGYISKKVPDYKVSVSSFPQSMSIRRGIKRVENSDEKSTQAYQVKELKFYEVDHYKWWHDDTDRYEY